MLIWGFFGNRALMLEDAGRPCSFRVVGYVAFHDMTLVGRASYLLQHTDELGYAAFEEAGRILWSPLCRCVMSCVFRPEIDVAVQVCLDQGALGARIVGGGFGGAVMALIPTSQLEVTADAVATAYAVRVMQRLVFLPMVAGFAASHDWAAGADPQIFRCCKVAC